MSKLWDVEDTLAAYQQGWAPFHLGGGRYVIQKLDDPAAVLADMGLEVFAGRYFESDDEALAHVKQQAAAGDDLCRRALLLVQGGGCDE
jgi:hypothetical protein